MRRLRHDSEQNQGIREIKIKDVAAESVEPLLTPTEMASVLRVPLSWIYNYSRRKGKNTIPIVRCGKYLRFSAEKVRAWLDEQNEAKRCG